MLKFPKSRSWKNHTLLTPSQSHMSYMALYFCLKNAVNEMWKHFLCMHNWAVSFRINLSYNSRVPTSSCSGLTIIAIWIKFLRSTWLPNHPPEDTPKDQNSRLTTQFAHTFTTTQTCNPNIISLPFQRLYSILPWTVQVLEKTPLPPHVYTLRNCFLNST